MACVVATRTLGDARAAMAIGAAVVLVARLAAIFTGLSLPRPRIAPTAG